LMRQQFELRHYIQKEAARYHERFESSSQTLVIRLKRNIFRRESGYRMTSHLPGPKERPVYADFTGSCSKKNLPKW
jgi:hypothetical protein